MAASVPCKKTCVCGPFYRAGKINYPLWWYGDQGILYNFAGGSATPNGCVFKDHGYWFDGTDDYLIDEQGRKILREGTEGLWSTVNLDCDDPPSCGSITGSGTVLRINLGLVLPPDIGGSLVLHSHGCPNLEELRCDGNNLSMLDVAALTPLSYLRCNENSISVLDVSALTSLTVLRCETNSMNQAMVDTVLCGMDGYGTNNGTLNISSNAVPSATGVACKNNLIGRGWTVTTD